MTTDTFSRAVVNGREPEPTTKSLLDKWTFINKINSDTELSASAKVVAVNLMWRMNCRWQTCFPKQTTVARETGLSERGVRAAVVELRDRGWLSWGRRGDGVNVYRFEWDREGAPELPGERQEPGQPANSAGVSSTEPANSAGQPPANSAGLYEPGKDITREALPSSSASPQKTASRDEAKPSPSADQQAPQEGSPEWYREQVWNHVGPEFKAKFYPTVSGAAFKRRLGGELKRIEHDLRKMRTAMIKTIEAEPGGDAWEYLIGMLRAQPHLDKPRLRGTI